MSWCNSISLVELPPRFLDLHWFRSSGFKTASGCSNSALLISFLFFDFGNPSAPLQQRWESVTLQRGISTASLRSPSPPFPMIPLSTGCGPIGANFQRTISFFGKWDFNPYFTTRNLFFSLLSWTTLTRRRRKSCLTPLYLMEFGSVSDAPRQPGSCGGGRIRCLMSWIVCCFPYPKAPFSKPWKWIIEYQSEINCIGYSTLACGQIICIQDKEMVNRRVHCSR